MDDMKEITVTEFQISQKNGPGLSVCYYQHNMGTYHAHVFLSSFSTAEELQNSWKRIVNYIAVRYQSKIRAEIERANFYIGFFCAQDMENTEINLIEQDTFCARKYVFDDAASFRDPVAAMENHIFRLELSNPAENQGKARLSKIVLQNFRGYKGRASFDLTDREGKPASFVLLYAPNGTGKTSFSDGIEFALNGKVERLEELKTNSQVEGPVYHHFDKKDQKSYVQLFTQDENHELHEVTPRLVPPLKDGKEAHANLQLKKGFLKGENWNSFLLPHDKVDSFITANTPEQRFNSWTKEDTNTKQTAEEIKGNRKTLLKERRTLKNQEAKVDLLRTEVRALEEQKELLSKLKILIAEYNVLAGEEERLPEVQTTPGADSYTDFMMTVKDRQQALEEDIASTDAEISLLNIWIGQNPDDWDWKVDQYHSLQQKLKDLIAVRTDFEIKRKAAFDERNALQQEKEDFVSSYYKEAKELEGIQAEAISYLKKHENTCSCPVCHSRFDSWTAMLTAIQRLDEKESKLYQDKIAEYQRKIAESEERYNSLLKSEEEILLQIESCRRQIEETEENIKGYLPYYKNSDAIHRRLTLLTSSKAESGKKLQCIRKISTLDSLLPYLTSYQRIKDQLKEAVQEDRRLRASLTELEKKQSVLMKKVKADMQSYFSDMDANRIYRKIDPNNELNSMEINIKFHEEKPQLNYTMHRKDSQNNAESYTAELFLSTAQLNAVAFSSFFARALAQKNNDLYTIVMDDPIGSFDDMNMLGFADLIRCIIMNTSLQIIMSTHDSKIYNVLRRKLNEEYHSSRFYELPNGLEVEDVNDPY